MTSAVSRPRPGVAQADRRPRHAAGPVYPRIGKRCLDVAFVLAVAPFVLPFLAAVALLIKRDGGPAFYQQPRVGEGGRVFRIWKLRSMVVDADRRLAEILAADPRARAEWAETQKLRHDPRITRLGRLLRQTSLDELPQLWNVLAGEMSLVGPRPFLPEQRALYPGQVYYLLRPGLTGLWQVADRNETSFAARSRFDDLYATQVSLATDLRLIALTVAVVLRRTGR